MAPLTISNYLGMLQEDPDAQQALDGLREAVKSGDATRVGSEPIRLLEVARQGHESRGDLSTVAVLIECEIELVHDDRELEAALWKELGRLNAEDLLDPAKAKRAYQKAQELNAGDEDVSEALRRLDQAAQSWSKFAKRFVEEADQATDLSLKTSLLVRAASLVWQFKKKGRAKEVDRLFQRALEVEPAHPRAVMLYEQTLRSRGRWDVLGKVLLAAAEGARTRDERLHLYQRAARVFARRLDDKERAAACYERVLDFQPTHAEAMAFLVELFTEQQQWDHLVALYEDALRVRQKIEVEEAILLQIGMVHWRKRGAAEDAEPYFARLRKIDPSHPAMLDFYRELYEDASDPSRWLGVLTDAQRVVEDRERKLALAVELARTAQRHPAMTERCIDAWKLVQRLDPGNVEAPSVLKDLYKGAEKWNAYVEVLKAEIDGVAEADVERKVGLLRELVEVYRDQLHLDVMVINTYNALLELVPDDREALGELAHKYEALGRWNDLIHVLLRQAEVSDGAERRIEVYLRVAGLWIERFANYNQATEPLEKVLELDPHNRDALDKLKQIYTKKRAWRSLYEVLDKEVRVATERADVLHAKAEMARLAGDRLHDHESAIRLWREVIEEDASVPGALDALEKLAERQKDRTTLAEVLEKRAEVLPDPDARVKALQKLGVLYLDDLANPEAAEQVWRRILAIDPRNGRALRTLRDRFLERKEWDELESLYADAGDWEALVDVLGGAADKAADPATKVSLSFRAARVYESRIGEPQRAFRSYERILSVEPHNLEAARALAPIYRREEKWSRLVGVLEIVLGQLADDATNERLDVLGELRDLALEQLRDGEAAFQYASQAYVLAPEDAQVLERLETAAERAASFERLIGLYRERAEQAKPAERLDLWRRIASIAQGRLGRTDAAVEALERILEATPDDLEAIETLERIYRTEQRPRDLCRLLAHRVAHDRDTGERWAVLAELARLEEEVLGDADRAADRYRAMLEIEPGHAETLAALDRLITRAERWEELADVLHRRQDAESDPAVRVDLGNRLGTLLADRLGDPEGAREQLALVLTLEPGQPQAVAALEQLMERAPGVEVVSLLEDAYEVSGRYDKLAALLRERLAKTESDEDQRALRLRLAEISASKLGDAAGAYGELEAAFLSEPTDPALWDRLAEAAEHAGQQAALANAYARALGSDGIEGADAAELAARTARLYDVVLAKPEDAEPFHRRVLAHDPTDDTAFGALKELYTNLERWDDLQALYRDRIAETLDAPAKLELLLQVCFLFEEILDKPDPAIDSYEQVLELEPEHPPTLRALERLYERRERWRDLVKLLKRQLDQADGQDIIDLTFRLAELHEIKVGEPEHAVDCYEAVLQQAPTHLRAQQALERLLSVESQRQRIATVLEPLYESQGAYPELARILEIKLEAAESRGERVDLLMRLAELYEQRLHDNQAAFDAMARAVETEPSDAVAREQLGRLAAVTERHRQRAELLERALSALEETSAERGDVLLELARIWDEDVRDDDAAERAYEQLIRLDPDDPERVLSAARALERIHLHKEDHTRLARDIQQQIRFETDDDERRALLIRLADLSETVLVDMPGAVAAHRQRLELDPGDVDAMRSLERLLERQGEWADLVEVLRLRDGVSTDLAERHAIAHRIGGIYEEILQDPPRAIETYADVLSSFGPDRETLAALARLYEATEQHEALLETLMSDLELAPDAAVRASVQFRAAELMRLRTGEVERALDLYAEVLENDPAHTGTLSSLDTLMGDPEQPHRADAARIAAPRYEQAGSYDKLLACLEVMAGTAELGDKLAALQRAAEVADARLGDTSRAFAYIGQALEAGAGEPDAAELVRELARLAGASGRFGEYVELLQGVAGDIFDADLQIEVYERIAEQARHQLNDAALARTYYAKIREQQPDHAGALDALEALTEAASDHAALIEILQAKADLATSPGARHALLLRQADIYERALDDVEAAIAALEEVTADSDAPEAFAALERLYDAAGRHAELVGLYEQQLERQLGDGVTLHHKTGLVQLEKLGETLLAIEHLRSALTADPGHEPSIETLEGLLRTSEQRALVAEILEPVYLTRMDWAKLTAALEARFAEETEADERRRLLVRLAQIYEDQLEDYAGTLEIYARLLKEDPRDEDVWETLHRLAKHEDAWQRLADVYDEVLRDQGVSDASMARLAMTTARICDERVGHLPRAAELLSAVLELDPSDASAFEALESVYLRQQAYAPLLALYRTQADLAASDAQRIGLLHKMAQIHETHVEDLDRAIDTYREVLDVDPADPRAVESLDGLLGRAQRWDELGEHLRHRIEQTTDSAQEVALRHRLGDLLAKRLGDTEGAIDAYEEVTRIAPQHAPTIQALELLVQQPEHTLRITQLLEPIYQAQDQWKKLIAIYEAQIELGDDPVERVRLLSDVARLHESRGNDLALAFHAWARAFVTDPEHDEVRAHMDRVAARLEAWDDLVGAYERAAKACEDPVTVGSLLTTIARVHDERRGDPRSAIQTYERLVQHDPEDPTPLDALEALHTMVGDWRGLVAILQRKVERSMDPAERGELLRRVGSVLEELLGDRSAAIEAYERAVEEDPEDVAAFDALDRLFSATGDATRLFDVLKRRIELATDPDVRVQHGLRLGKLADEHLRQSQDAVEAYQRVLDDQPAHRLAIDALARLYEREGMWAELLDNLKLRAGMSEAPQERVGLLHRAGEVLERELDDVHEALSVYQQAIETDAAHEPSIDALIRISRLDDYREQASEILEPLLRERGRFDDLAQLVERAADASHDPLERRVQLRRLADIHEQGRGDRAAALDALTRALGEDAADLETADDLERLAESLGAWDRVADVFGARASSVIDPHDATALYQRLGRIAEAQLGDEARAIEAYRRALEHSGDDDGLLDHLDRLYARTEQWQELADVLDRRIGLATDPAQRSDFLARLGVLREQRFGDGPGALAAYQEVLEEDLGEARALAGLERLVQDPGLAPEVVEVLERIYRQQGAMDKVAGLYAVRLQLAETDGERVPLLQESAAIWEGALGDAGKALDAIREAFALDPSDPALLGELERLAELAGRWDALRGLVESAAVTDRLDVELRRDLGLRAAGWYRDRLDDPQAAEAALRTALAADAEADDAHAQLVDLLRQQGRTAEVVGQLRAWAEVQRDPFEQRERLRDAAGLAETELGDVALAADIQARVLSLDEGDPEALDALLRLRRMQERWEEVADLYARRIEGETDPVARLALRHQLAALQMAQLGDGDAGAETYQAILDEDPFDTRAMEGLESFYQANERWDDLHALIERRLELAQSPEQRVAARVSLARLAEQRFGKRDEAIAQLQEILAEQPGHREALDELERLLRAAERWDDVGDLLWQRVESAAAADDAMVELALLERLGVLYEQELNDTARAMAVYARMLERDPQLKPALLALARLHEQQQDWEGAISMLEPLRDEEASPAAMEVALRIVAIARDQLADPERTEEALRAAYQLDPTASELRDQLKAHYRAHGRHADLAAMLAEEEMLLEDPAQKIEALREIAALHADALGDPASAVAYLERAAELVPEERSVLLPLCDLYVQANRQRDAIAVLEKIIASFGGRRAKEVAIYEHRLGQALESLGDADQALQHYEAAFKIDLTNVAILRDLGKLCLERGDLERAQKSFRALLLQKLGPDAGIEKADVYYYLGRIAQQQGDRIKAKSMLERAISEAREHADAQALLSSLG